MSRRGSAPVLDRRLFLRLAGVVPALAVAAVPLSRTLAASVPGEAPVPRLGEAEPFDHPALLARAAALSREPYDDPRGRVPAPLAQLDYDQYRDLRYRESARLWQDTGARFHADLLPAGFLFDTDVAVHVVEDGMARRVLADGSLFDAGPSVPAEVAGAGTMPLSGFRVRHPINTPGVWDEFFVAQGATYFRAVGRDQLYGLSARALALQTADPDGEEFPVFRAFWLERPLPGERALVVYALLDSPSTTGAYRLTLRPGDDTVVDVEQTLYPRVELTGVGLAPLTSMFLFDATNRGRVRDFRDAVHDSSGLRMLSGAGEWLWRPLANPRELQISAFLDTAPQGFGLVQWPRRFEDFQDLEARYERRPSAWVEPLGDWGSGAVQLVELPTDRETNDNIIVFWRPDEPLRAGGPWSTSWRLRFGTGPAMPAGLARVEATRMGQEPFTTREQVVIDFGGAGHDPAGLRAEVQASAGRVESVVLQSNPETGGLRLAFALAADDVDMAELRARVLRDGNPVSETWLYRWKRG